MKTFRCQWLHLRSITTTCSILPMVSTLPETSLAVAWVAACGTLAAAQTLPTTTTRNAQNPAKQQTSGETTSSPSMWNTSKREAPPQKRLGKSTQAFRLSVTTADTSPKRVSPSKWITTPTATKLSNILCSKLALKPRNSRVSICATTATVSGRTMLAMP